MAPPRVVLLELEVQFPRVSMLFWAIDLPCGHAGLRQFQTALALWTISITLVNLV